MLKSVCNLISRYMGVLVVLVALVAFLWPQSFSGIRPVWISPLLGLVMFGMGLTLNPQDFKVVFMRPKDVLVGCLAQFTVMPGLAWVLCRLFDLPQELALGVILVGCCPGGTASNVITYLAKGDLALSVGMTATSTVLAPLLTPLLTWLLAGKMVDVNVVSMFVSIVQVVILPIIAGFIVRRVMPSFTSAAVGYLPALSSITIALIVGIIVAANSDKLMQGGAIIILVVILHNVCGLLLGFSIARVMGLGWKQRVAVSIEVGMQNSGLASSLATLHFAYAPLATIPGAIFSVWHNISGALMAHLYGRHAEQEQ